MGYHVVDMSADPRCGQFAYFRRMTFPFAGITAEVDITDLMAALCAQWKAEQINL